MTWFWMAAGKLFMYFLQINNKKTNESECQTKTKNDFLTDFN